MVLTKLFGNKKGKSSTAVEPSAPEQTSQTNESQSVAELVNATTRGERKEQLAALTELADRLKRAETTLNQLRDQGLPDVHALALQLHHEPASLGDDVAESVWVEVAQTGFAATVRKQAAERVSSETELEALAKRSKGHDKAVYRIAKDRLESLRQQARERAEREEAMTTVIEAMERHAQATLDPLYSSKLKSLVEQWQDWENEADAHHKDRFNKAREQAEQRVQELKAAAEAEEEEHRALAMADTNRRDIAERVLQELHDRVDAPSLSEEDLREAQMFLTEQQHAWRESEQLSKPNKDEERAFHRLCTAFEATLSKQVQIEQRYGDWSQLLDRLEHSPEAMDDEAHALDEWLHLLDWPEDTAPPERKHRVENALARHHDQLEEHRQKEVQTVRQARGLMRRCLAAVNEGHLKRASGLLHGVQDALDQLTQSGHPGLFRQFDETREAVEKLRDWQSFAVKPKKEALIERMAHLLEQSMDPPTRARTIRSMQDEWRLLSQGLQNQHQDLWERFHELAQKAYEPCREYFNEQSKLRGLNLEKRRELVQQLEQYEAITDWENPDIKEVDRVLNMARQDWRKYSPVDRAANKPVQKAFDEAYQRLRGHLQHEQAEFREAKLAIIERARALLDEEDIRHATETAKQLQKEWQEAGHLARRDEQALWKDFRAICDELFDRRGRQIEAFKAELETHRQEAERIIADIEVLSGSDEPVARQERYQALRDEFKQLGTLPKAHHKDLMDRYNKACRHFDDACRAQRHRQKDQQWQTLIDWVYRARFDDEASVDGLVQAFEDLDVPPVARDLVDRIEDWREAPTPGGEDALRRKTVELEILADAETPEQDRPMRMELQVQRLQEGMGQSVSQADFNRAVVDWLSVGAVAETDYAPLAERMKDARTAWLNRKK